MRSNGRGAQARRAIVSSSTVHLGENKFQGCFTLKALGRKTMLKTFAVALLAIAMPLV
jgi:hypothetical protein